MVGQTVVDHTVEDHTVVDQTVGGLIASIMTTKGTSQFILKVGRDSGEILIDSFFVTGPALTMTR